MRFPDSEKGVNLNPAPSRRRRRGRYTFPPLSPVPLSPARGNSFADLAEREVVVAGRYYAISGRERETRSIFSVRTIANARTQATTGRATSSPRRNARLR